MSSNRLRLRGHILIFCCAIGVSCALSAQTLAREEDHHEANREVVESELRVELAEQELQEFLEAGGDRDSDKFQHLIQNLVEARTMFAVVRHRLAADHRGRREGMRGRTERTVHEQMEAARAQVHEHEVHLEQHMAALEHEKHQLAQALKHAHQELEQRRRETFPSMENTETRVFQLRHVDGSGMGHTLREILGDSIRIAQAGDRILVMSGPQVAIEKAVQLLTEMDRSDAVAPGKSGLPDSLMVRIFWLSDGETYAGAEPAGQFLPDAVIGALGRVGIEDPFIVLQSNTAVALDEVDTQFEVNDLPAIVFNERLMFNAKGAIRAAGEDRLNLWMGAFTVRRTGGSSYDENHVQGSLLAPLGHFAVLGTANYAELGAEGKSSNSQFAFVVQVIEAESFAPNDEN